MKMLRRLVAVASAAFFIAGSALAQNAGAVSNHAIVVGKGVGNSGYTSVPCGDNLFLSGVTGADPACRALLITDLPKGTAGYLLAGNGASAASYQGFLQGGTGAVTRTWQNKVRETISVTDFGAICDNAHPTEDTAAFLAAIASVSTSSDYRGATIKVPRGRCNLTSTLTLSPYNEVVNIYLEGEGSINTTLDFSGAGVGTDAISITDGVHFAIRGMMISGARRDGVAISEGRFFDLYDLRIQGSVRHGVYVHQGSYMGNIANVWSRNNGDTGFVLGGGCTSLNVTASWGYGNTNEGWAINDLAYSSFSAVGADNNRNGYYITNVRAVTFNGMGHEANSRHGVYVAASNAIASGAVYPDIYGLSIVGSYGFANATSGGGYLNWGTVEASDGRTAQVVIQGAKDENSSVAGSFVAYGTNTRIFEVMNSWSGTATYSGGAVRTSVSSTGTSVPSLSIGGQAITLGGAFTTSGANALTLTTTGSTNVTLPTSGTLATLDGSQTFTGANIFNNNVSTFRTGSYSDILFGRWSADTNYAGISVSGSLTAGSFSGFFGGANPASDPAFYMVSAGDIHFRPSGASTNLVSLSSGGSLSSAGAISATTTVKTGSTTVGSLGTCNSGAKGTRYFVTDANATTFGSTVAGSGSNNMPVVCNGTNWIIGSYDTLSQHKKAA